MYQILHIVDNLFVCFFSDARNMARDVHDTLLSILQECGQLDSARAADYIKKLQNKGRYSCDVWS